MTQLSNTCDPISSGIESRSLMSIECTVCGKETSQSHSCPGCFMYINTVCGRADEDDEEGFGSSVCCPCDIKRKNKNEKI